MLGRSTDADVDGIKGATKALLEFENGADSTLFIGLGAFGKRKLQHFLSCGSRGMKVARPRSSFERVGSAFLDDAGRSKEVVEVWVQIQ